MSKYENSSGEKAKEMISGAKASFEASINLQGKPSEGEILELISGEIFYPPPLIFFFYEFRLFQQF